MVHVCKAVRSCTTADYHCFLVAEFIDYLTKFIVELRVHTSMQTDLNYLRHVLLLFSICLSLLVDVEDREESTPTTMIDIYIFCVHCDLTLLKSFLDFLYHSQVRLELEIILK